MKRITELNVTKWRTVHYRDDYGSLVKDAEEYETVKTINVISGGIKFAHFMIDLICFQIVVYVVNYLLQMLATFTASSAVANLTIALYSNIFMLLLYPALYALCEFKWQRTPAKFLTNSIVIDEYGNRPELRAILLRSLVRIIPFEPFSCLGEPSSGWHDRWSNTWVVSDAELAEIRKLQSEQSTTNE